MKENFKFKDEVQKLSSDLSKYTKGKQNEDKLLGNLRSSNDKTSLGFEENSRRKGKEEKPFAKKSSS